MEKERDTQTSQKKQFKEGNLHITELRKKKSQKI